MAKIEIYDVEFSIRTYNILKQNGILYLNDLTEYTTNSLLKFDRIGKKSFNEIREKLAFYGMSLKDESLDLEVKRCLLIDLPKILSEIKDQVSEAQHSLRVFQYKIDQISEAATKAKNK